MNVEENIELPLTYLNIPKAERKAKVQAIMKRMAISHRAKHFPHQLSGGQQQRVAIARALAAAPAIILADEPTGNLDRNTAHEVFGLMLELQASLGTSLLIVTHDPELAAKANRVVTMRDGLLV